MPVYDKFSWTPKSKDHPLPEGSLVQLVLPGYRDPSKEFYLVEKVRPLTYRQGWYYSLVIEEWWESRGMEYINGSTLFHGKGAYDHQIRPFLRAEDIYEHLRREDP